MAAFKRCPAHSPEVYHADRTMATIVMRYIGEGERLRPWGGVGCHVLLNFHTSASNLKIAW